MFKQFFVKAFQFRVLIGCSVSYLGWKRTPKEFGELIVFKGPLSEIGYLNYKRKNNSKAISHITTAISCGGFFNLNLHIRTSLLSKVPANLQFGDTAFDVFDKIRRAWQKLLRGPLRTVTIWATTSKATLNIKKASWCSQVTPVVNLNGMEGCSVILSFYILFCIYIVSIALLIFLLLCFRQKWSSLWFSCLRVIEQANAMLPFNWIIFF